MEQNSTAAHTPHDLSTRLGRGVELSQQGEKAAARRHFDELWLEIGPTGDPLHRLTLAHWMADVQEDPQDELAWDLLALNAADDLSQDDLRRAGLDVTVAAMYPSLYLNVGEAYRKVGDLTAARLHLDLGLAACNELGDDGYGQMIKKGLSALADRIEK